MNDTNSITPLKAETSLSNKPQGALSTDVKQPITHVVMTYSKVHHFINEKQAAFILGVMNREPAFKKFWEWTQVTIDGNICKFANIADVLTIEKYYDVYPNKRPDPIFQVFPDAEIMPKTNEPKGDFMEKMIEGLQKAIAKREKYGDNVDGMRQLLRTWLVKKQQRDLKLSKKKNSP